MAAAAPIRPVIINAMLVGSGTVVAGANTATHPRLQFGNVDELGDLVEAPNATRTSCVTGSTATE